mgnify:CR=1 FL=1
MSPKRIQEERTNGPLFINTALSSQIQIQTSEIDLDLVSKELSDLGYPLSSIESMNKCGKPTGFNYTRTCKCTGEVIAGTWACNLRTCLPCSLKRKKKIRKSYMPLLNGVKEDRTYSLEFLTVSPENFVDLEFGLQTVRKSFSKWLRLKYVKDRLKGGIYGLEAKKSADGSWNVHIHAIIFSRFLDNRIRGKCLDCGQNYLKKDSVTGNFYCASRQCNSTNVLFRKKTERSHTYSTEVQDSTIVSLFKKTSGLNVHIDIKRLTYQYRNHKTDIKYTLNYLLKYISTSKEEFTSAKDMALFIKANYKKKLITKFGSFFAMKPAKLVYTCKTCGGEITYESDYALVKLYTREVTDCKPPPTECILNYSVRDRGLT